MNNPIINDESYPIFVPNQVLESEDLNAVVDYLNNQSRLTRSQLIGQGIAQGMIVSVSKTGLASDTKTAISISAGVGIAADGQLIVLDKAIQLAYYKSDDIPQQANGQQKPIELFAFKTNNSDKLKLIDQSDTNLVRISKDSVLTVICAYEDTARPSPLLSYTEMGKDRQFYPRFFLLSKESIEVSTSTSTIAPSRLAAPVLRRFGYQKNDNTVRLPAIATDFSTNYSACCKDAIETLHTSLQAIVDQIKTIPALSDQVVSLSELDKLTTGLTQKSDTLNAQNGIQYFYDYLNQIAAAHRELIETISELTGDRPSSPKIKSNTSSAYIAEQAYLLLGQINLEQGQPQDLSTFDLYRQRFVQRQLEDTVIQPQIHRVRYLFTRLLRLSNADNFQVPSSHDNVLKIIPSGDRSYPLSQQAIPYYLNYANLSSYWNYDASLNGTIQNQPAYAATTNHLISSLDAYQLYRIEGHVGRSCRDALAQINTIQQNYNLAFDVLCLKLNAPETTAEKTKQEHLFRHFAQSYPGLEHLGGVPKGGTFILVYVEQTTSDVIIADFSLPYPIEPRTVELLAPPSLTLSIDKITFTEEDDSVEIRLLPDYGIVMGEGVDQEGKKFYFHPGQLKGKIKGKQQEIVITGRWGNHTKTQIITVNALTLTIGDGKTVFTEDDDRAEIVLFPEGGTVEDARGVQKEGSNYYFYPTQLKGSIKNKQEKINIVGKWGNHTRTQTITVNALILSIETPTSTDEKSTFTEEDEECKITLFPEDGVVEGEGVVERSGKFYFQPSQLKGKIKDNQKTIKIIGEWGDRNREIEIIVNAFTLSIGDGKSTFTDEDEGSEITLFPEGGTVEGRGVEERFGRFYFVPKTLKGTIDRWADIVITGKWNNEYIRTKVITVNALVLAIEKTTFLEDDERTEIILFPTPNAVRGEGVESDGSQFYFVPSKLKGQINGQKETEIQVDWGNHSKTQKITVYVPSLSLSIAKDTFTEEDDKVEIILHPQEGAVAEGRGVLEQAGKFYFQPSQLKGKISGRQEEIEITARWGNQSRKKTITVQALTLAIAKNTFTEEDDPSEITLFPDNGTVEGEGVIAQDGKFYFQPAQLKGTFNQRVNIVIAGQWNNYRRTQMITVNALTLSLEKSTFTVDDNSVEIKLFPKGGSVEGEGVEQQGDKFYFVPSKFTNQNNKRITIPIIGRWGNYTRTQIITVYTLKLSVEKTRFIETDARAEITLFPDYGIAEGEGVQEQAGKFYFLPSQLSQPIAQRVEIEITGKWGDQSRKQAITVIAQGLAEFRLNDVVSSSNLQGNEIRVELDRTSPPVPLIPTKIQEGTFRAFTRSGSQEFNLDNLFQQNPWALVPQNAAAEITEFTVEYKLQPEWGEQTSSIIVSFPNITSALPDLSNETDTESRLEPAPPTVPESSVSEASSTSEVPPVSEAPLLESNKTDTESRLEPAPPTVPESSVSEASSTSEVPPVSEAPLLEPPSLESPPPDSPHLDSPIPDSPLPTETPPETLSKSLSSGSSSPPVLPLESPSSDLSFPNLSLFESSSPAPLLTAFHQPSAAPAKLLGELPQPNQSSAESSLSSSNNSEQNEVSRLPISDSGGVAPSPEPLLQESIPPDSRDSVSSTSPSDENSPKIGFWQKIVHILNKPIG